MAGTSATPATEKPREPATAEEAAKVLDLRTFPLMENASTPGRRRMSGLLYEVEVDVKAAFEFPRRQFLERGWKELPGAQLEATYAGAYFTKEGFTAYVAVTPFGDDTKKKGVSQVLIGNYGNVELAKLPLPTGVKPFYSTAADVSYLTEAKVPETAEACRKLLLAAGWAPYGMASTDPQSPMMYFKRNAVRLMAWVSSAPAQGGKTVIKYSTEQLCADLPMPPTAPDPRYYDDDKTVRFDWPGDDATEVVDFYQTELTKKGWKSTTERPVVEEEKGREFLVFRNPQKDMVSLDLNRLTNVVGVLVQHRTAAEVAELDRQIEEAAERARQELARKNRKVKVPLPLPARAKKVEVSSEGGVEITLKSGGGPGALEGFRAHFLEEGWTEVEGTRMDKTIGRMRLQKEDATLSLSYFDAGIANATVTISGSGVILDPSKAGSAAGDDAPKTAAQGSKKPSLKDIPGLSNLPEGVELPDLGEVPDEVQDLVKKALEDVGGTAKQKKGKGAKAAAGKGAAEGTIKVAEIPIPEDATDVEYKKTVKMISVKTASDARTLATFFTDGLIERGWSKVNPGLVDDNSAILKLSQGGSEITIFVHGNQEGSEATLTTRGLSWESVPSSKKSAKKTVARAEKPKAEKKKTEKKTKPADPDEDDDDDSEKPDNDAPKNAAPAKKTVMGRPVTVAEQKQTGTRLTINNIVYKLEYGVAFESTQDEQSTTEVLLAEKPIAVERIIAALKQGKEPDVAGFQRHLKFRFDVAGKLTYLFMYADGLSINRGGAGSDFIDAELTIQDGRARGKGVMKESEKFFEQSYRIEATFDAKMATGPADPNAPPPSDDLPPDRLIAEDEDGLPFPDNKTSRFSTKTPFRKTVTVVVPSTIAAVSKFYQRELTKRGWKENPTATKIGADEGSLSFAGAEGSLSVNLTRKQDEVTAILSTRNAAKAKADGILPQPNRGRLILGNASNQNVVLTINGQQYKLAAMRGARDPKDGTSLNVLPGRYTVSIQAPGQAERKEELNIAIDETWGVIVIPSGDNLFADLLY